MMARMTWNANQLSAPTWAGDFFSREHLLPGGAKLLAAGFLREDAVVVTTTAEAVATATTIAVTALSGAIPSGAILTFGSGEFAKLTAAAAAAATSLTVEALPATIESGDTATYTGTTGYAVRSGTLVGRTFTERAAGTAFGPWTTGDEEVYLVVYDVVDVTLNNDVELYLPKSIVKENFLPGFTGLAAGAVAAIRATYTTTRGVA